MPFAEDKGIVLIGVDHEGHGRSEGVRGHVPSIDNLVLDLMYVLRRMRATYHELPMFVLGESMGGAVALMTSLEKESASLGVKGYILVAPMCHIADELLPPAWLSNLLSSIAMIAPTLAIVPAPNVMHLCMKDQRMIETIMSDPLVYQGRKTLGSLVEALSFLQRVQGLLDRVSEPLFVLHGAEDAVIHPESSRRLFEAAASTDKTHKLYDSLLHGMLVETDGSSDAPLRDIIDWIEARTPSQSDVIA